MIKKLKFEESIDLLSDFDACVISVQDAEIGGSLTFVHAKPGAIGPMLVNLAKAVKEDVAKEYYSAWIKRLLAEITMLATDSI